MKKEMYRTGLLFVLPITTLLAVFLYWPILQSVYYSLTDWRGVGEYGFIGLRNYYDIFNDRLFMNSLKRTLYIGITAAFLANVFGLALAVMLDQAMRTKNILRALFVIPHVIPLVVAAFVWRYILDANTGLVNTLLTSLFDERIVIPWIDSPDHVVNSIIMITVWQMMGPIIIIYLAALQSVPGELLEAGKVDGASKARRFFSITIPMIAPGITVNILVGLANGIRIFDLPFALTGGGPANASETLAIRIYRYAFRSDELAYGMAASFVMTVVVLVVTFSFIILSRRYERGMS